MTTFELTWLGCAGVIINTQKSSLLIDPFVSRPSFLKVAFGIPFHIDHEKIKQTLKQIQLKKHRAVAVGHSHYDHACDAPYFAKYIQAFYLGNSSSLHLTQDAHLEENKIIDIENLNSPWILGDQKISFNKGQHESVLFGKIPYPGKIETNLYPPLRASQYREGGTSIISISSQNKKIIHVGSAAGNIEEECDILLLTIAGIIDIDNMFIPLSQPVHPMPFLKLKMIIEHLQKAGSHQVIIPTPFKALEF